ncbi:MAG: hypothetical protein QT11_C0001G0938 [archaeon GW2011_AR20]|nr:MAG: hypothetical protein QT11_C0001G0938 [archaeon GW2011_AR20]MBS3160163.1 hypothetical protein [Candidatus Woesearchaeota archaeon]
MKAKPPPTKKPITIIKEIIKLVSVEKGEIFFINEFAPHNNKKNEITTNITRKRVLNVGFLGILE